MIECIGHIHITHRIEDHITGIIQECRVVPTCSIEISSNGADTEVAAIRVRGLKRSVSISQEDLDGAYGRERADDIHLSVAIEIAGRRFDAVG